MVFDAAIIGGGPAGSAIGRLLASWGYRVRIVAAPVDRARGLAESLPPSTRKLLAEVGVLDAVDAAGFLRGSGNTAYWASTEPRIEMFDAPGYQIFRPDFDALLLECARAAGADVRSAVVRRVDLDADVATVEYDERGERTAVSCRFVIDCSGRAGIVGRRFRRMDDRVFGFVGVWRSDRGWDLADQTHTIVETFDDGWAWSVPVRWAEAPGVGIDATTRHVGVMVGETGAPYDAIIARTSAIKRLVDGASLERTFACDASTYSSSVYAGPRFLLVGDAGSFIDPLSSFGVKKALASAWLGAIAVHTSLVDPDREDVALGFFGDREREMQTAHGARAFARTAYERHPTRFWERHRDAMEPPSAPRDDAAVAVAFERFRASASIDLR
ncbi:MAG TPA: NAD(P)/FAD-dependent oxidoreductase, partial [Vicinamibacterales bacterium]|nr:NAD(P)/FAD-dependent oxidoreductase [Vicinamibacterales bacterium]